MVNKMERFTQDARKVLKISEEFAETLKHPLVEPEHLLLAMTKAEVLKVYNILNDSDIVLEKLLPFIKSRMPEKPPSGKLDVSAATQKTLELAVIAARRKGHSDIDSTHLLMALLRLEHRGMREILSHFQADAVVIKLAVEQYWNPDAGIEKPIKRAKRRKTQSLPFPLGFGEKQKNDGVIIMPNQMERFTDHSRRILSLSQDAAKEMGHLWIEPEHILLGMARSQNTTAFFVLSDAEVIAEKLLPYLRNRIPQSLKLPLYGKIGLSDGTMRILYLSAEIANQRDYVYIDPSILLLAMLQMEHKGIEAALAHFGHDAAMIIEMTKAYLGEDEPVEKPSFMNNIVQSFQELFRKKKNDE